MAAFSQISKPETGFINKLHIICFDQKKKKVQIIQKSFPDKASSFEDFLRGGMTQTIYSCPLAFLSNVSHASNFLL